MASSEHKRFMQQYQQWQEENNHHKGKPIFAKKPLDLFKLWCAVQEVGGHSEVIANKGWARIGRIIDPDSKATDLSSRIKKAFETHFLAFEQAMLHGDIQDVYVPPRLQLPTPTPSDKKASRPSKRGSGSLPPATRPKRSKKETAAVAAANEEEDLVDKRVRVFWPEEKQYFSGRVAAFDKEKGEHTIEYDDGDEEQLDLKGQDWHLISHPGDDEPEDDGDAAVLENDNEAAGTVAADSGKGQGVPEGCIGQGPGFRVYHKKDGSAFEVFCLVPGLQMEDLSVKCWDSGKLLVCQNPKESDSNEKWGITPLKHKIRLPKPVEARTARALVTLHGQLYISVSCPKSVGRTRKVATAQPSTKAQDQQLDQKGGREPAKEVRGDQPQAESAEQQRSASPNVQPSSDSPQLQAERPQPQPNTLLTTETPADIQTVQ